MPQEGAHSSQPKLVYYDARGTALKCRLLLADLDIHYQWTPLSNAEEILQAKANAPSGKLPIWEDSMTKVSGSVVVLEYLGASLGKYSTSLQVQAAARSLALFCEELLESMWKEGEVVGAFIAANKDASRSEIITTYRQNRILPGLTVLTRDMLSLRALCSDTLYTDYAIVEVAYYADMEYPEILDQFPPLRKLLQTYSARPAVKELFQSLI